MSRIDFSTLEPLPLRRQRDTGDRERLAHAAHLKKCAKHHGRNHWRNWERRKMLEARKAAGKAKGNATLRVYRAYVAAVRDYWCGVRADHPEMPA